MINHRCSGGLGTFSGQRAVCDESALDQMLAKYIVLKQPCLMAESTRQPRCLSEQDICFRVETHVAGVDVIASIGCFDVSACCLIVKRDPAARRLLPDNHHRRTVAEHYWRFPFASMRAAHVAIRPDWNARRCFVSVNYWTVRERATATDSGGGEEGERRKVAFALHSSTLPRINAECQ